MKKLKEFTVDCDKWLRGDAYDSCLKNSMNEMCCLGFLGEACGVKNFGYGIAFGASYCYPNELKEYKKYPKLPSGITWKSFAKINDDPKFTDKEIIKLLREKFKKAGIKIKFTNIPK